VADLFDHLLVSSPNGGGLFLLLEGEAVKLDALDTTGLDIRENRLVRAIQPSTLVLFNGSPVELPGEHAGIGDLHDALIDGGLCYVISTHGNEVVRFDSDGVEQRRWTFPGERDAWHINCLARWNGRLVFSAFADRPGHRAYKEPPFDTGFVQDLETGERPITGLSQPHSLVPDGERLLLANSGESELRAYDRSGALLRKRHLDGYTRGVAFRDDVVYVGLSKSRNIDTKNMSGAAVVALDAETWEEIGRIRLPVDEIYAIQPIAPGAALGGLARLAAHANARLANDLSVAEGNLARVEQAKGALGMEFERVVRDRDERQRESDRRIFGLLETVQGKDVQIQNRDTIIHGKDAEIQRRDELLAAKEAQLQSLGDQLRDKDRQIFGLLETVHGKDIQIQNRDEIVRGKDAEIQRRDELSEEISGKLLAARQLLLDRERQVEALELRLGAKENLLERFVESSSSAEKRTAALRQALQEKDEQIAGMVQTLAANSADLAGLAQRVADMHQQLDAQSSELAARAQAISAIQSTISWRLTRPLRAVRHLGSAFARNRMGAVLLQPFRKTRHVGQTLRATLGDPERRQRYLTLARVLGPRAAAHHTIAYLRRGGPRPRAPIPAPVFDLRPGLGRRAVILTTPHCDFVAHSIRHALEKIGVESNIIHARPEGGYEDLPHFVVCPQMFEQLPGLYVAFQMEQSVSTRWFTDAYMRMLENSFAILDYSVANVEALVGKGLHRKQFFYLPLGYLPGYGASMDESGEYDVVFYGDINNDRRKRFVAALEKVCRVKVFNNLFGDELHAELAKAKLIVNIHYYEGALLETTRLWECVSLGKLVVSERAVNMQENRDLESLVDFVDLNDVDGMVERVQYWLAHESTRVARIKANREAVAQQPNRFEYFFYRFLLAWDIITFHRFWELAGSKLTLPGDRLCLNLPEWFGRRRSFDKDNHYGFSVFPGLRHHQGWIGCGMSYKLMIMLARKQHMRQIVICEDDVEFREGFQANFEAALVELLKTRRPWDVFSGFLGDLHTDAKVTEVVDFHGRKLALTDKLISMVFNIYNRCVFDRVALWDERDRDVKKNTIDRYLERTHLLVQVCYPFLVGHKGELHSTLWGVQNGEMEAMVQRSEELLGHKIDEFAAKMQRA
jgi:hypothetical protein